MLVSPRGSFYNPDRQSVPAEDIPAPGFLFPVRWLRVGNMQPHLF